MNYDPTVIQSMCTTRTGINILDLIIKLKDTMTSENPLHYEIQRLSEIAEKARSMTSLRPKTVGVATKATYAKKLDPEYNKAVKKRLETDQRVLDFIYRNPWCLMNEIAAEIGCSHKGMGVRLNRLRKQYPIIIKQGSSSKKGIYFMYRLKEIQNVFGQNIYSRRETDRSAFLGNLGSSL